MFLTFFKLSLVSKSNKRSNSFKINLSLMIISMLITINSAASISKSDFYDFYNLNNIRMNLKLNFSKGNWYHFIEETPDNRFMEFHSNVSGFVHSNKDANDNSQLLLNHGRRVLIFYADRPPIFGTPLALRYGLEPMNNSDNVTKTVITPALKQFPGLADMMNFVPFYQLLSLIHI